MLGPALFAILADCFAPVPVVGPEPPVVMPSAPPPRRIVEQGPSPYYYRKPRDTIGWGYRLGLGAAVSLASTLPRPSPRFTLDVLPEVDLGFARGSRFGVLLEGGYSFTQGGTHLLVIGAGPAARHFGPTLGLGPRGAMAAALVGHALVGTVAGQTAVGVRTSVLFHLFVVGVEIGHQYTEAGPQRGHELRLMIDLGTVGFVRR